MVGGDVIAAVEQVVAAVVRFVHIVGVFDQREEREAALFLVRAGGGQVEPVRAIRQQLVFSGEHDAQPADAAQIGDAVAVVGVAQLRRQLEHQLGRGSA